MHNIFLAHAQCVSPNNDNDMFSMSAPLGFGTFVHRAIILSRRGDSIILGYTRDSMWNTVRIFIYWHPHGFFLTCRASFGPPSCILWATGYRLAAFSHSLYMSKPSWRSLSHWTPLSCSSPSRWLIFIQDSSQEQAGSFSLSLRHWRVATRSS